MAFCRTRLAGYKQPRLIRFIDALPQTASGKVQRDVVRQQLELNSEKVVRAVSLSITSVMPVWIS